MDINYFNKERERRRTDRARERSAIMSQRRQAAQTEYMDRMAQRARSRGASAEAVSAIRYGESMGANQDRQQGYMNSYAQRELARSQGYAARTSADAGMRSANANYMEVQQRPEMQAAQITADQRLEETRGINANRVAGTAGEYGIRQRQLEVAAAREEAQAERDAATIQSQFALQAQREMPIPTESGVVRRTEDGSYTMDAFPTADPFTLAEADYQNSSALGKVWKDPIRALVPFYDPKINE